MRRMSLAAAVLAAVVAVGVYGCGTASSPKNEAPPQPATAGQGHQDEHAEHAEHADVGDMKKMKENLAKLSDADRAAAEKQHFCPVSGKMLGSMDAPIKVTVKGQDVWLCCEGCEEKIKSDPDKYLAKLKK